MITGLKCYCVRTALVAAFVLCFEGFASAQAPSPTPDEPLPTPRSFNKPLRPLPDASRVGVVTGDELSLTLAQAIEMALGNNHDIEVSRKDVHIAEFNFEAAKGIYDPLVNSQSYYESRTTPTASTIGGTNTDSITQRQFYGDLGLSGFCAEIRRLVRCYL
jgi:outer membrane protein TolC